MEELDGEQRRKLDGIRNAVAQEETRLAAVVGEYNATVKAAYEKLRGLIDGYTRAQGEFDRFHSEIVDAMTEFVVESPDEWQETDRSSRSSIRRSRSSSSRDILAFPSLSEITHRRRGPVSRPGIG